MIHLVKINFFRTWVSVKLQKLLTFLINHFNNWQFSIAEIKISIQKKLIIIKTF